jgi:AhpD family alkylhydroperoxidase
MPHIPLLPLDQAEPQVQAIYDDFCARMQCPEPPNFILTQGHSRQTARGTWDLVRNILVEGEIPRWQKELVFVAISKDRNCGYCSAAHLACCRMLGVSAENMVRDTTLIPDLTLREIILFARKCASDPQSLTAEDYDRLGKCGLSRSQILELIAMSGLAVYANIMADATAMEPDAMFSAL